MEFNQEFSLIGRDTVELITKIKVMEGADFKGLEGTEWSSFESKREISLILIATNANQNTENIVWTSEQLALDNAKNLEREIVRMGEGVKGFLCEGGISEAMDFLLEMEAEQAKDAGENEMVDRKPLLATLPKRILSKNSGLRKLTKRSA